MVITEMTQKECGAFLASASLGRLGCSFDNQPYVVPIYFVYEPDYIYVLSTFGQKTEWMRANPKVCLEVDEITNQSQWMSVIASGRYQELPEPQYTADLAQFTGSENWYRHGINRNVLYTDGAQHVAEHGGTYWLLDEIAIIQPHNKAVAAEEFQVWKLAVRPDRTATLTCDDGNGNIVFSKEIEHTDFSLDEITLYFANNVIHLPSEY
jgi:hypothetical protein